MAPKVGIVWRHGANELKDIAKGVDALYAPMINGKCRVFVKELRKDVARFHTVLQERADSQD